MSEARPWIGSFVSCAYFKTTRPLKIVDFSVYHRADIEFYDTELDASGREKPCGRKSIRRFPNR